MGQKSLSRCGGDGRGHGNDVRVLLINCLLLEGILVYLSSAARHALLLASPAIPPGGEIPSQRTCEGADVSLLLT